MRVLILAAAVLLAGCSTQYEKETTSTSQCYVNGKEVPCGEASSSTNSCSINGESLPCQGSRTPTGPREDVAVEDEGDALQGVDRTWSFSVHPNATRAQLTAIFHGPGDSGVILGEARYQLIYPGGREAQPCTNSNNVQLGAQVNLSPQTIVDRAELAVGDWSLRLCIEPSPTEYDVSIHVTY